MSASARVVIMLCALASVPAAARTQTPLPDSLARRIDSVYAAYDKTSSPGCALAIYQNGAIRYSRGYGMSNLEHGIAISPGTIFDIGSTSKQFTGAAIALLAQDGKLSIDDDVRQYLPELPQYARPITLRMLLTHTSGLRDYLTLMSLRGVNFDGVSTDQDALDLIIRQSATNFEPGSTFLYSNTGFFLLSQVVKRVSGRTLAQFSQERIFTPLGMSSTHIHDDHTLVVPGRAAGYSPRTGGGFQIDMSAFEQTGDGAVMTTVEDLLEWDNNYYAPTIGGQRLLDDLETRGRLNNGTTLDYALGLFIQEYRGLRNVRHGGAFAGFRAELSRFPSQRTTVASLCNLGSLNPSVLADRVADIVLAAHLVAARPASPPVGAAVTTPSSGRHIDPSRLAEFAGVFYAPELDAPFTVAVSGTHLTLRLASGDTQPLTALADDRFSTGPRLTIAFTRDRVGRVSAFTIDAGRVRGIVAARR